MSIPVEIQRDPRYSGRLFEMETPADIPKEWQGTPVEKLIRSENFEQEIKPLGKPELLIVSCIEYRYALPIPSNYAYVIRRASGRLIGSEFTLAYVLSRGVEHVVLIGHNDCGMAKVPAAKDAMITALVKEGWDKERANEYISFQAARYSIEDEITSLHKEYVRLRRLFRRVHFAPMFVCLADTKLYVPSWYLEGAGSEPMAANIQDEELLSLF